MNLSFNFNLKNFIFFLDYILFSIVIIALMFQILDTIFYIYEKIYFNYDSLVLCMAENETTTHTTHTTSVKIIMDDGSWSTGVKKIFIYGTGALRVAYARTPYGRFGNTIATLAIDKGSDILDKATNDPTFIRRHLENWNIIWKNNDPSSGEAILDPINDDTIKNAVKIVLESNDNFSSNSFLPDNFNLNNNIEQLFLFLKGVLEPANVNYSNELLAEQIQGISIVLFIMCLSVLFLFFILILNVLMLMYADKFQNYFTNKYIIWYIKMNRRIIGLEVSFLSIVIVYGLYNILKGILFIATHSFNF